MMREKLRRFRYWLGGPIGALWYFGITYGALVAWVIWENVK